MKSIKVNPGETFELIITDDKGNDMVKQCYSFNPETVITMIQNGGVCIQMDLVPEPTVNYQELFAGSKLFGQNKNEIKNI